MRFGLKGNSEHAFRNIAAELCAAIMLAACGGGGGSPGTGPLARYDISLATNSSTVVFGGVNTRMTIKLSGSCGTGGNACDNLVGREIAISSSNPSAVSFTPSTVITNADGEAQVTVSAASVDVAGVVQITATTKLTGYDYSRTISLGVNNAVDRTITAADDQFVVDMGTLKSCTDYQTFIINVKNRNGVLQDNAQVNIQSITQAEGGVKDLGVLQSLGHVWWIQARPALALCDDKGVTPVVGDVMFNVLPGDGSAPYSIGYRVRYTAK
ncbi:hypothetical protein [Herminiimonas sp. CN]|uniref:hypothetical protein n=1 Tax=Herminiimonas sp. CN TaxID=1349818 RepID=UPI000556CDF0|nr:hypothetical protein [Herminiimonas sp. CN]